MTLNGRDELTYEDLLNDDSGAIIKEKPLPGYKGRLYKNRIAIRKDIPTLKEKACVLAEELGHYHTTVGNILDQSVTSNRKQERTARLWAYDKMIGLSGIIKGYQMRCQNRYELAECLGVTEEFLQEALDCYKEKYGPFVRIDKYTIVFEPALAVMERF